MASLLSVHKNLIANEFDAGCDDQFWALDGQYIVHSTSGKVLDIAGSEKGAGARICLYGRHGGHNQLWALEHQ